MLPRSFGQGGECCNKDAKSGWYDLYIPDMFETCIVKDCCELGLRDQIL